MLYTFKSWTTGAMTTSSSSSRFHGLFSPLCIVMLELTVALGQAQYGNSQRYCFSSCVTRHTHLNVTRLLLHSPRKCVSWYDSTPVSATAVCSVLWAICWIICAPACHQLSVLKKLWLPSIIVSEFKGLSNKHGHMCFFLVHGSPGSSRWLSHLFRVLMPESSPVAVMP